MAKASEEHTCYFCGDSEETVLVPICKGCLDSFNRYIESISSPSSDDVTENMNDEKIPIMISPTTAYRFLQLKNHITIKIRSITNEDILERLANGASLTDESYFTEDFEPDWSWDDFLTQVVETIWWEQQEGKVAFIT